MFPSVVVVVFVVVVVVVVFVTFSRKIGTIEMETQPRSMRWLKMRPHIAIEGILSLRAINLASRIKRSLPSVGPFVKLLPFGSLVATYAVYTALFSTNTMRNDENRLKVRFG